MAFSYLIKSPRHMVQLLGCNVLTKGYKYYVTGWVPEGRDPLMTDARLILLYGCHTSKYTAARRRRGGIASVKYYRCGRFFILIATEGRSLFHEREQVKNAQVTPIHINGYSLSVTPEGKPWIRIHREAQRKLKRDFTERAAWSLDYWEKTLRAFPFRGWRGVNDNVYHLVKHLNYCRKLLRLPPVDWRECVRKKLIKEPVFLPSPPELLDLLAYEKKKRKAQSIPAEGGVK